MSARRRRLVLVGGGHANVQVIDDWIRRPIEGVELTVVSPESRSPYSGMVPGWLAGLYDDDAICIDVASLCARASAVFIEDEMRGLDAPRRRVRLKSGRTLDYDVLSIDVGSTLDPPAIDASVTLPLRPLSDLRRRWDALLSASAVAAADDAIGDAVAVLAVGGGAAGFEALLALERRLAAASPRRAIRATLTTQSQRMLPQLSRGAARRAARVLRERRIALVTGATFDPTVSPTIAAAGETIVLWATGARAHRWQAACGLATDPDGYFTIDRCLRSTSHPDVFATGDCAAWSTPLPKAGVYAVRMGAVLVDNLRAALGVGTLRPYRPQTRHLVLLSTADRRAIASWGPLSWSGAWVWRWKDRIDRAFVDRFKPMARTSARSARHPPAPSFPQKESP